MSQQVQIILDDAARGCATVFERPSHIFVATEPSDVMATLDQMQRARERGAYLAGYFSYELGYLLEPRLAELLPTNRKIPLLWFGQFDAPPLQLTGAAARALWPDRRVYATPLVCEWDRAAYRRRFQSVLQAIRAGETYEVNLSMR
ncbi:MAG TPA: hypothetical protein VF292_15755, partial [Rhodanobacteraceae bacterium]